MFVFYALFIFYFLAILYELIYKTVLPECQKKDKMKEHANDSETADVGDNNKNTWVDVKSKTSKGEPCLKLCIE